MELQYGRLNQYMPDNICMSNFKFPDDGSGDIIKRLYVVGTNENMCPRDYALTVDTKSWGACLCWENGGRRSKNGTSAKCLAAIPVAKDAKDTRCSFDFLNTTGWQINEPDAFNTLVFDTNAWCIRDVYSSKKQVCPITFDDGDEVTSYTECDTVIGGQNDLPDGLSM